MNVCIFGDARSVHVHRLAHELSRRDVSVHVVTHKPADVPGATVERFSVPPPGWNNLRRWRERRRRYLEGFLRRFDVVNVQFVVDWGFEPEMPNDGVLVATAWGSDLVTPPGEIQPSPTEASARRRLLGCASVVTACGPTFAEVVARYAGLEADTVRVVPFGVDTDVFRPSGIGGVRAGRLRHDRARGEVVGFPKGFRRVYGAKTLLEAIPQVLSKCPSTRFELVGDGADLEECRAMARVSGLDSAIDWLPRLNHAEMPEVLRRWSVCVIPSVHEAFGVAALEASASGVAVVASDVCGLRDTVCNGQTGVLVPSGDVSALGGAITSLLEDPERRRRMGETGRAFVGREYDARRVYDRWVELYTEACERSLATC